jgi:hypothetical protein
MRSGTESYVAFSSRFAVATEISLSVDQNCWPGATLAGKSRRYGAWAMLAREQIQFAESSSRTAGGMCTVRTA